MDIFTHLPKDSRVRKMFSYFSLNSSNRHDWDWVENVLFSEKFIIHIFPLWTFTAAGYDWKFSAPVVRELSVFLVTLLCSISEPFGERFELENTLYSFQSINNYSSFYPCVCLTSYISGIFFIMKNLFIAPSACNQDHLAKETEEWIITGGREHQMRLYCLFYLVSGCYKYFSFNPKPCR